MLTVFAFSVLLLPFWIRTDEVKAPDLLASPCLSKPCVYGVCVDDGPSTNYRCYCQDGYTGLRCQTDFDDCRFGQCLNGATCVDKVASVQCVCPDGYSGHFCALNVNECLSNPCLNGACCVDKINGFECHCLPGYEGARCEIDLDYCNATRSNASSVCRNGGICVDGSGISFHCRCPVGFDGVFCEHDIDECLSSPCFNGGECIEKTGNFSCNCPAGWTGRMCEVELRSCENNHCQNEALCLMEISGNISGAETNVRIPRCYCIPDYHGEVCDKRYNECDLLKPCLNGATCVDGVDSFVCQCEPGFIGNLCQFESSCSANGSICPTRLPDFTSLYLISSPSSFSSLAVTYSLTITPSETDYQYSSYSTRTQTRSFNSYFTEFSTPFHTQFESTLSELTVGGTSFIDELLMSSLTEISSSLESIPMPTKTSTLLGYETTISYSSFVQGVATPINSNPSVTDKSGLESEALTRSLAPTPSYESVIRTDTDAFSTTNYLESSSLNSSRILSSSYVSSTTPEPSLPSDCADLACNNGGTILRVLDDAQQATCKCLCLLHFTGSNCEDETKLVIPHFSGHSFLTHRYPKEPVAGKNQFAVLISFRTTSPDAFLLYSESMSGDTGLSFVLLSVEEGGLSFTFSCGSQIISLTEKSHRINTGYFTAVSLALLWVPVGGDSGFCEGILRVNDSSPMIGKHETPKPGFHFEYIYVGGFPMSFSQRPLPPFSLPGFRGCVKDFQVNNVERRIIEDAVDGADITECQSYGCAANPCLNSARCISAQGRWFCVCKEGYWGVICERATCLANPCQNGGTCVSEAGGFFCLCPYGKRGKTCEESAVITRPSYYGSIEGYSSYLLYNNPHNVQNFVEIRIRFTARMQHDSATVLLVYAGQSDGENSMADFLALGLDNGYVVYLFNLGTGVRQLRASHPLLPNQLVHTVYFGRHRRYGWLRVNGFKKAMGLGEGQLTALNVAPEIYVGGHSSFNFSFLPEEIRGWRGFKGCVFDEEIRTTPWAPFSPLDDISSARNVHQCDAEECQLADCDNGASCQDLGSTFICHCQPGWTGPLCKVRMTPCSVDAHKCSTTSRCVPSLEGYRCDCPLGLSGRHCEKNTSISDPLFRGQGSFMSFAPRNVRNQLHLLMEIRSNTSDAVLFYASQYNQGQAGDFVYLYLRDSFLEFRFNLGTGVGKSITLRSLDSVLPGVWTTIKAGRKGRYGYLEVDGQRVEGSSPKGMKGLDIKTPFYLGGVEDSSSVNREATEGGASVESFRGCVRLFKVNGYHYRLTKEGALDGLNVADCDGTSCGYDVCQHNGTCQYSGQSFTCICPPSYVGVNCELPIQCSNHQCQNGATCRAEVAGLGDYRCICPPGFGGDRCQLPIELDAPSFSGESYMIYKDELYNDRDVKENYLSFNFSSREPSGILLWNGKRRMEGGDYLGMGLTNGHLKLVWNLGWRSQNDIITGNGTLDDGQWHAVTVERSEQSLHLAVDGKIYKSSVQGDFYELNSGGLFYQGGFPEDESVSDWTGGHFGSTFRGCVTRPLVGREMGRLTVVGGADVQNCPSQTRDLINL